MGLMSLFVVIISFFMVAHNVNSATFNFPGFQLPNTKDLTFEGDAIASNRVLKLTKTAYGVPLPSSAGRASFAEPVHLWDEKTGELAGFTTNFFFDVEPVQTSPGLHGDGITFFIAPFNSKIPQNSTGGFLGLFSSDSAFNAYQNQIVAVEFDTFADRWDPISSHIGIDINSIVSTTTVPWRTGNSVSTSLAFATVTYEPVAKNLSVLVKQIDQQRGLNFSTTTTSLSLVVDLRSVLPEWVRVGFSGATGLLVENHRIYAWDFKSSFTY
ncbi:lectin 7-like [Lotus japonicus]|uniref:lectin 7-like n=1 Tax=Lotus japonicus TaxID=34305 RepID=UPI0025858838|nr:lectin 7-like [Lotus japonicus]